MEQGLMFASLFLAFYATPHVANIVQPNDEQWNCAGLQNKVAEPDKFIEEAESEKGANWGNAGRLLVFTLGI